jgi:type IV pilus assembly protein PilC
VTVKAQPAGAPTGEKKKKRAIVLFDRVKLPQIVTFTTQLSTLQDAGLPIVRSVKILELQQRPGKFKDQLGAISEEVEGGATFSEALGKYPKSFDKLYVSMVKAGEAGGVLDVILNRLANFMEKSQKLRKKVKGALIYPTAVLSVAGLILFFILTYVVPSFEAMFKDLGQKLPAPTQFLLSLSTMLRTWWFLVPAVPFTLWTAFKFVGRNPKGRLMLDGFKLRMPVFGTILKKSAISRFCRTLGTLIASGVPILEALRIVKDAIGNVVISNAIEEVHGSIREGDTIAGPLRQPGIFDELLVNMIDVGEETGELDKMLIKISDNYETDVDVAVEGMSSLLEPLLIVGMGGVVGFIVVALFLPLIEIIKTIK